MQKTSTYKLEPRNIFRKIMDHIKLATWHLVVNSWLIITNLLNLTYLKNLLKLIKTIVCNFVVCKRQIISLFN